LFLGAEVGEEAALAHLQLICQTSDGHAFQPFHGGQVHSHPQDAVTRALPFGQTLPRSAWTENRHAAKFTPENIIARTFVFILYCFQLLLEGPMLRSCLLLLLLAAP